MKLKTKHIVGFILFSLGVSPLVYVLTLIICKNPLCSLIFFGLFVCIGCVGNGIDLMSKTE